MKSAKQISFLTIAFLFLIACQKQNLNSANNSLIGNWQVVEIYNAIGEKTDSGTSTTESFSEEGDLGNFVFNENTVAYNYTKSNEYFVNNEEWNLERTKQNQGFHKVEQYFLTIGIQQYRCRFGDETSDAEKDATAIQLEFESTAIGPWETYILFLEKE